MGPSLSRKGRGRRRIAIDYDPRLPEHLADPFPVFAELRERDPVHWNAVLGGWVLTRYADVKTVLHDRRFSADRITPFRDHLAPDRREGVAELLRMLGLWAVFNDPPEHTRRRALLNKAFTSRAVEALRPTIARIVDHLLDRIAGRGAVDLIADFAYPLPATVIAGMIGVPASDLEFFKEWSDDIAAFVGSALATPDKRARAQRGVLAMTEYFRRMVAEHRARPREDIMSGLIAAEEAGSVLSEDEIVASCVLLLFAGHETTTNLIGNGMLALLRHPAEQARLSADPALAAAAVEEMLRYDGPTQAMTRIAREAVELGGRRLREGDRVFALLNAANRDPTVFAAPDRFDLARGETRHLSFGWGGHFCLGAPLARLEGQIGVAGLVGRLGGLALAEAEPPWNDSFVLRGLRSLPVVFDPAG
jgi:cytochrome P450